jgi:hypothetical protein
MKLFIAKRNPFGLSSIAAAALAFNFSPDVQGASPENISPGVVIEQTDLVSLQEEITKAITSAPPQVMSTAGLVGAQGGAGVRILKAGTHQVLIPIPQLAGDQIPVAYFITTNPREAGTDYRIRKRGDLNVVVSVQLNASDNQEIQIDWASIILIVDGPAVPNVAGPEVYVRETSCVQSQSDKMKKLAEKLWPDSGRIDVYAANIQEFIRNMKQSKPPRSLDALGILESGSNWICTANGNLAVALLRAKAIPARSISVIPSTAQRLEMHRVVEYFDSDQWVQFDPSSLHKDIPMKPWQNIIMATTTIADESIAMRPRMGTSLGCPYGQELEFFDDGLSFFGNDFFWTIAKPLAEFDASDKAINLAKSEWNTFLDSGKLSRGQIKAASARNGADFVKRLEGK